MSGIVDHLEELRWRLITVLAVVFIAAFAVYAVRENVLDLLLQPLHAAKPNSGLVFTGVPDIFFTYLKLAVYGGVFVAIPVLCWHVWRFAAPGLYKAERAAIWPYTLAVPALFYGGLAFALWVVTPLAVQFFYSFETGDIQALPVLNAYLSFVLKMMLGFGLAFLLPVVLLLLVQLGLVQASGLARARRFMIVGIFIMAAVLTPPDPLSQLILAGPLWVLLESAIFLARWVEKEA